MNLEETIKDDIKTAMKGKDMQTLDVLRLLISSVKNKGIELKRDLEDADVLAVIKSDVKKLEDALAQFIEAARKDLSEKTKQEIEILKKYLPEEMSIEALEEEVKTALEKAGISDVSQMGQAMAAAMENLKGKVDGKRVKEMVEKLLKRD